MRFGQIAENITRYTVVAMRTCASKAEINSALPLLWMCVPFVFFLSFLSANKVPPLKMSGKTLEIPIIFLSFSQWSISRSRYLFVQVVCFAYFYPKKSNMKNLRICKYQLAFVYLFKASCKNWNKWKRTNFNRTCKMSCRLYLHYGERIYFQRVSAMAQYINSLCQQLPHVRCQIHEISIRFAAQIYLLQWISFTLCLCVRFTSQFVLFN